MEKVKLIAIIENRIKDEYRKHKELDWPLIAAVKIAGTVIEMFPEACVDKADSTSEKDLRVCDVIASYSTKSMSPKEKAEQLYNKVWYAGNYSDDKISHICATLVVTIFVNEICKEFYPVRYWDQVKIELEKMKCEFEKLIRQ